MLTGNNKYSNTTALWPVHTTRVHRPCLRAVNAAREHGRHFWTPVNTARVIHWWPTRPVNTGVILCTRVHRPCSRAVFTAVFSMYTEL